MMAMLQVPPIPPVPGADGVFMPYQIVDIIQSVLITIAVLGLGVPIVRAFSRRFISRPAPPSLGMPTDLAERLERIEQAVDAIAIEMERVAESQRYTTKLLAETRDAKRLPESR